MTYSGIFSRTRSLLVLATLATAVALPTLRPADAAPNHDGVWSVVIITNQGICDPSYRYPIRISKGSVLNAGGSNTAVTITGKVEKNGAVVVNVAAGDKTATGTGKLAGTSGGGSWSGGNGACSGVWQAERRSS